MFIQSSCVSIALYGAEQLIVAPEHWYISVIDSAKPSCLRYPVASHMASSLLNLVLVHDARLLRGKPFRTYTVAMSFLSGRPPTLV